MATTTTSDEQPNGNVLHETTMTLRSGRIVQKWRRRNFAFHIVREDSEPKDRPAIFYHAASRPLRMRGKFEQLNRLHLYFPMDIAAFQVDAATKSFRELRVFDKRPRTVQFTWLLVPSFDDGTWMDMDGDREITFGQIIDVMTKMLACNATPYHMSIDWPADADNESWTGWRILPQWR
jgi:hypothetical protein